MAGGQVKNIFTLTVLGVWAIVVISSLVNHFLNNGPLPDPILLGIPSGTWLAMNPPLPRTTREEQPSNASS